jgi:protoporphyrinogen oxidase
MKQTDKKNVVVVGAGIAGLTAGLWAQSCGYQVTLIERTKSCGGLLRSFITDDGNVFDYGTHIPLMTSNSVVDHLIFDTGIDIDWVDIKKLKKGNYFRGKLNTTSQFIDINMLAEHDYRLALAELINSLTTDTGAENLHDALHSHFGSFLTESVFKPLLSRIYRKPFSEISPSAHRFLAYTRVVVGSSAVSKELKRSPVYDSKIGFTNSDEGGLKASYRYPRHGGTGAWVQSIVDKFIRLGGKVFTETGITSISTKDNLIKLSDSREICFDSLIWTGPIGILARMVLPELEMMQPDFVPTRLHHFVLTEKPQFDSHYVYMNDPDFLSFRVTLYPNITNQDEDFRITVEAVASEQSEEAQSERVFQELKISGIISHDTQVKSSSSQLLMNGFPEMTVSLNIQNDSVREQLEKFSNLVLGGRGASDVFL